MAFRREDDHLSSLSVRECSFMPLRGELAPWPEQGSGSLGREPGLHISWEGPHQIDLNALYQWITGESHDWSTGIQVTSGEIWGGLSFWLALHAANNCGLSAVGAMVDRHIVPPLFSISTPQHKSRVTHGLLTERGLAVLALTEPPAPLGKNAQPEVPADLFVRSCGPDEAPVHQLIGLIRDWDASGRPSGQGLEIRVYPRDLEYRPAAGQVLIKKRWTQLILNWIK